ncbi:O-methyltransferase asqD [Lachnellula suecica]|uniref:O-methyltransferase asqD n=1 Tax=Lachnellula suecica TaxID=602035 RepID=A0A8T9BW00_9HELO|nr:O-methyltransferase asqD [Lachnellula suecica]
MSTTSVDTKIDALAEDLRKLIPEASKEEISRKKLFGVIQQAMGQVEAPVETIWRMIMSPHAPAALNVIIRMGVLDDLVAAGKPKPAQDLGSACKVDPILIVRMMRPLVALGIFQETDVQTYDSTPISQTLVAPPLVGGYLFMFECATRSLANMPNYLESTGFQNVTGGPGPFETSHNTEDGMFQYLNKNPALMSSFNAFMSGSLETRKSWFETFPVQEILLEGASTDPDSVLLIDIGGGEGHDVEAFRRTFPDAPGKLVLQDLPPTIDNIKHLDPVIITQKYDFFTEQTIKGARAYYFRNIFHDWPTDRCVVMLKNVAAAMKPGYSKLLIFEWVIPAKSVPLYPALLDINMMAVLNGQERTEEQWIAMLGQAGLEVNKFWKAGEDSEGLIEVVLKK